MTKPTKPFIEITLSFTQSVYSFKGEDDNLGEEKLGKYQFNPIKFHITSKETATKFFFMRRIIILL